MGECMSLAEIMSEGGMTEAAARSMLEKHSIRGEFHYPAKDARWAMEQRVPRGSATANVSATELARAFGITPRKCPDCVGHALVESWGGPEPWDTSGVKWRHRCGAVVGLSRKSVTGRVRALGGRVAPEARESPETD